MKYIVSVGILENACDDGVVHRRIVKREMERILKSGSVVEGEALPDGGGGRFVADVRRPEELFELMGSSITGLCRVETNPVLRCITVAPGDPERSTT